jgi:hypothetical protein
MDKRLLNNTKLSQQRIPAFTGEGSGVVPDGSGGVR